MSKADRTFTDDHGKKYALEGVLVDAYTSTSQGGIIKLKVIYALKPIPEDDKKSYIVDFRERSLKSNFGGFVKYMDLTKEQANAIAKAINCLMQSITENNAPNDSKDWNSKFLTTEQIDCLKSTINEARNLYHDEQR